MDPSTPPLLEAQSLVLAGEDCLEVGSLVARGPKIALLDKAGHLLRLFIDPSSIKSGTLLLLGNDPASCLASGRAAYIPVSLPLPANVKLLEALSLSAHLLGLSKNDARRALSRCRLSALDSKKLGDLTRLQARLASIAHGIIGGPQVLLIENVLSDLDEPETAIVQSVLEAELEGKSCVLACGSNDPGSRALALGCDEALQTAGNQVLPPSRPEPEIAPGYWVSCLGDVTPLTELLKSRGAEVARSPRPSVFFVKRVTGAAVFQAAQEAGLAVLEFTPSGARRDSP